MATISSTPSRTAGMIGTISGWTQKLRASTEKESRATTEAFAALDSIEKTLEGMPAGTSVDSKKEIRDKLWQFRQSLPNDAHPNVRRSYEKLRNLTLDNSLERELKGGKMPMSRFTTSPPPSDIPNFQVVSDNYLRGGQPDQDGLTWLSQASVKSRVDLRGDDRDNMWYPPVWNPIKTFTVDVPDFASPSIEMVEKFLAIVDNPVNQPVFVHCKAGIGRTGVMTACMNIAHGMTADEALEQESINSYHGNLTQEAFVRDFESYWLTKQAQQAAVAAA